MNKLQGNDLVSQYWTHFACPIWWARYFLAKTEDWTKARTACAAASHPPLTPTPSWTGGSCLRSSGMTRFAAIFEANRRKTLPTAIGRMPPSFFWSAVKFAAKRRSRACWGIWPSRSFEQRLANAFIKRRPASAVCGATISFKCPGRRPSTPPALPGRIDFRATITSSSETDDVLVTGSVGGGRKSRGAGGCFSLSAVTTSDVGVITLSSDAIILTAAVTSPTKSLELTIFLKSVAHGGGRLVFFGRTARSSAKDVSLSANCPILVFMAAVNDWRLWVFDDEEVDKAVVAKQVSRSQEWS